MVQHATHGITSCMCTCQCGNTLQNPECTSQSTKAWNSRVLYWNIKDASVATLTNFNFHQQQWLTTIKQLLRTELELKMAFHSKQLHSFSWFLVFICFSAVSVRKSANHECSIISSIISALLLFFQNQHLMPNLMPALCVTPYPIHSSKVASARKIDRNSTTYLTSLTDRRGRPRCVAQTYDVDALKYSWFGRGSRLDWRSFKKMTECDSDRELSEGDLFSFRVIDKNRKCLLPWHIVDVKPEFTFQKIVEEISQASPDPVLRRRLAGFIAPSCTISLQPDAGNQKEMRIPLTTRVVLLFMRMEILDCMCEYGYSFFFLGLFILARVHWFARWTRTRNREINHCALIKKLNSTERGALFRHFASPRWSPLRMRTKGCHFSYFSKSFQTNKKN